MQADLQNGNVGTNPDVVADGDWLADAVPLEALVQPHGVCFFHLAVALPAGFSRVLGSV